LGADVLVVVVRSNTEGVDAQRTVVCFNVVAVGDDDAAADDYDYGDDDDDDDHDASGSDDDDASVVDGDERIGRLEEARARRR